MGDMSELRTGASDEMRRNLSYSLKDIESQSS